MKICADTVGMNPVLIAIDKGESKFEFPQNFSDKMKASVWLHFHAKHSVVDEGLLEWQVVFGCDKGECNSRYDGMPRGYTMTVEEFERYKLVDEQNKP